MHRIAKHAAWTLSAALAFGLFASAPASAQAMRSWVSAIGDDANPCSRTAPCKTFRAALSKTASGGEINCLDPGSYGGYTGIGKSITIKCDYTEGGVLSPGTGGFIIDAPGATVVLIGLDIDGTGQGASPGTQGIEIVNANVVQIVNSHIRGFRAGNGILFRPQNPGATTHLLIDNTSISESGTTAAAAINVAPVAGGRARLTLTNSRIVNGSPVGLRIDSGGGDNGFVVATVDNTIFSDVGSGILLRALTGTNTIQFLLSNSLITQNKTDGILVNGGSALISARVKNTTITANEVGLAYNNSGELRTFGDNVLAGNKTDGAFTGPPLGKQ
jgi:hypothetical protein